MRPLQMQSSRNAAALASWRVCRDARCLAKQVRRGFAAGREKETEMLKKTTMAAAALLAFAGATVDAGAADYPDRPVSLVVGFPPGGASDILARIISGKLAGILGQPFVVDNRPGAGGNVAGDVVAHAAPDGYTLLLGNNAILATNASLYKKIGFDPEQDFAPISLIGTQANVLVVNVDLPVHSLAELIALAKAHPGKLNFASSGYGLAAHLAGELFKAEAHVDIVHVPYKGSAPALQDVIAGQDQMMFATTSGSMGLIKGGQVRPLAVTTLKRTASLPDIPTIDELGIKGFDATTWHGLVAPAGTPLPIIDKLHKATAEALADPDVRRSLADLGVDIVGSTPDEFAAYIKSEIPKWAAVIKASGATME
jgi:tripartite-type tricarboxylate transporter receptor subunit TctC